MKRVVSHLNGAELSKKPFSPPCVVTEADTRPKSEEEEGSCLLRC